MENETPKISEKILKCTACGAEKPLEFFPVDASRKNGRREQCRVCRQAVKRQWKVLHRDKEAEWVRSWRDRNPLYMKEYVKNNRSKISEIDKRYYAKKKISSQFRFNLMISRGICRALRGSKNGRSWESLVGYSCVDLRKHIERLFLPGMTSNNYGKWHVDHKIPQSAFNFEKPEDIDFRKCWDIKNLQPLWATDNIKKSNKVSKPHQPSLAIG